MKRNLRIVLAVIFLVVSPLLMVAQTPPHPNGGNAPSGGNGPVGGGVPVGNGMMLLVAMSLAYGVHKLYLAKTKDSAKE